MKKTALYHRTLSKKQSNLKVNYYSKCTQPLKIEKMTNEKIKNYPEGTKVKVFIPEFDREAWRGLMYLKGTLSFQEIPKETTKRLKKIKGEEWYFMNQEDRDFYDEFSAEKTFGISYSQPFTKRYKMFTIKKGTECVCYEYEAENFSLI